MTIYVNNYSDSAIVKLKNSIDNVLSRRNNNSSLDTLLADTIAAFKEYFSNLDKSEFSPSYLITGDTASSEIYNKNLKAINNDLSRFYQELLKLSKSNAEAYNYSQVIISEIKKRAESISSIVLDLNILNNFTRGDVIVGGDDFINTALINSSAAMSSPLAELVSNGAGLGLAKDAVNNLTTHPRTTIEVTPISPKTETSESVAVNTAPTVGNLNRFYEGNYYNFLNQARPEGGAFNIRYLMKETVSNEESKISGLFVEYGASDSAKSEARKKMFDGSPDTFWECEYVIKLSNPLLPDVSETVVVDDPTETSANSSDMLDTAAIQIDVDEINDKALQEDVIDLIIDLVVTLPEETNVNFVNINPISFGSKAYIEVEDIATASSNSTEFTTVEGWSTIRFGKALTPEINEYLSDSQLSASLAPSRSNYIGQGVFPFPSTIANKVKIRLAMRQPVAQLYDLTYVLLKNTVDINATITTTTTKGAFRF